MTLKPLQINQIMSLRILLVFSLVTSSLLGESLLEEASGNSTSAWEEATNENTDWGERRHIYAKGTVRTASSIFFSGKLVLKLPEIAEDLILKMGRAKGKLKFKDVADANSTILNPGSILMLNLPDEMYDPQTFFNEFNAPFLDFLIANKDQIDIVFTTKPEYQDLFKAWNPDIGDYIENPNGLFEPSGFAKEIKYLRDREVTNIKFKDGSSLDLNGVDLSAMDWETNWKH